MTDFGSRLYASFLAQSQILGRKLSKDEFIDVANKQWAIDKKERKRGAISDEPNKPAPVPRKRNELLDALIKLCGGDPESTTKSEFKTAANSLAEIKTVCPTLTIEELHARVERYKQKNRDWALTPPALAKWWSHLGGGPRTQSEKSDIYMEPYGWRSVLKNMYQLSDAGVNDKQWLDLGPDTRREILNKMKTA